MTERFYPKEENLGKNCLYWSLGGYLMRCCYPKAELEGRQSCEGLIDDVCLYVKDGRPAPSLSDQQIREIQARMPIVGFFLPPGDVQ